MRPWEWPNPDLDAQLASAAVERNSILGAVVDCIDYTDTVEASIAALPKAIHNFDCGANQGDAVPAVSLRNFVRHVFNWSIDDETKTVYKEDGTTPAYTSTLTTMLGRSLETTKTNGWIAITIGVVDGWVAVASQVPHWLSVYPRRRQWPQ